MNSNYILQKTTKSKCNKCHTPVFLLCKINGYIDSLHPAFYVCFKCEIIVQVGRGEVQKED